MNYRPDIDGVRAIAVLSVVLYHAGVPWLTGGFTGVDIFFVISGFLIGGHIYSEQRAGTFSFLRFYQRRAKRILPAFYVVISFAVLAAVVLLSPFEANNFTKSAIAAILSASNIYFLHGSNYFQSANEFKPLLMTWSLGVEEQFYLVIPLLMVLLARIRRGLLFPAILLVCALSFAYAWRELAVHPDVVFYLLPARAWELGVGVAFAASKLKGRSLSPKWTQPASAVGLALMLAPMYLLTSATPFPGPAALPSVLGTALVIATPNSWINQRLLSLPPLSFIGRISYSWYLWHWPLLSFLRVATGGPLPPGAVALAVLASFAAAVLSYYFIEQPFRKSSRAPAPLLLRYAAVSVAFLLVCGILWVSHGLPRRYPTLPQEAEKTPDPCLVDYGSVKPNLSSLCYAASDPRPSVVLWGDSHAAALAPALRETSNTQGYNFIQINKSSCLPLQAAALFLSDHPLVARECIRFNNEVLKLIAGDPRIRVVVMAGRWADPFRDGNIYPLVSDLVQERELSSTDSVRGAFVQSLALSIRTLQEAGKKVIVVDDVPNFNFDPLLRFRSAQIPARHLMAVWLGAGIGDQGLAPPAFLPAASMSTKLLSQTQEKLSGVELIDLKSKFCNSQNLCAYIDGDRLLYSDSHHVTPDGARYALQRFRLPGMSAN
jgi:peptidoglycan/LPS O-acetylase OafA/YrhL